ncbi:hypothetical protein CALCODRAFT_480554 [Calocera cornea HHB12733]|uniref:Trafficking protein particle complex II-specific subunit 65 IgD3 domain-containing protein n=1 Tax=Calocera cornea HHB12733 TaxID=1353952 RepID=A0A165IJR1_9BASI|nr:hypothetical protein CALCODRAFT_480554 [Calocera cornea HHB12733]
MSAIEALFGRATVDILLPSSPFSLSGAGGEWEAWRESLTAQGRTQAFYDERLPILLTLKLPLAPASSPATADAALPPPAVLSLLARTQLTLEASYINPNPNPNPSTPLTPGGPPSARPASTLTLAPPGRSASLRPAQHTLPGSLQPPQTPVPTPGTADWDRKYSRADGLLLGSFVWGEEPLGQDHDGEAKFALVWGERERAWTALFRMDVTVAYLRTRTPHPLLCLTCSATLRDKPLPPTAARSPLHALLQQYNISSSASATPDVPQTPYTASTALTSEFDDEDEDGEEDMARFEEVNLLDGLVGPVYGGGGEGERDGEDGEPQLELPSTRLSHTLRRELFSLPTLASPPSSAAPTTGTPTPLPTPQTAHTHPFGHGRARSVPAIMRKAFRRVLPVVSGLKVRMRASFLPRSGLPDEDEDEDGDGEEEAGTAPQGKRCVLSVEVENAGEGYGFELERIALRVSGEDSRTSLIAWDLRGTPQEPQAQAQESMSIFPLRLKAQDQYNLLYNVVFTRWLASAAAAAAASPARAPPGAASKRASTSLGQRTVVITVHGRPFLPLPSTPTPGRPRPQSNGHDKQEVEYVTASFPSTWNCTIDVTPPVADAAERTRTRALGEGEVLPSPNPASAAPFRSPLPPGGLGGPMPSHHLSPIASPLAAKRAAASDKRAAFSTLTLGASPRQPSTLPPRAPTRSATLPALSALNTALPHPPLSPPRFAPTKPSSMLSVSGPNGVPVPVTVPSPGRPTAAVSAAQTNRRSDPLPQPQPQPQHQPPTPAFPPYSAVSRPRTPMFQQLPAAAPAGGTGAAVEPRRNRVSFPAAASPGPSLPGPAPPTAALEGMRVESEPVLVSVALQYPQRGKGRAADREDKASIEPLDTFSLEIFVFNQSTAPRKLVVSYPTARARAGSTDGTGLEDAEKVQKDRSGFLPLENQKTIGPLLPGTCQSIQMPFLALRTGVHTIDTLELHDPDTGYTLTLRQVMTVVVRDPLPSGGEKAVPNGA